MAQRIPRVPVREQDPKVRAHNFEEVCYGYNLEEATTEASRCLHCKNPRCVQACPVSVKIPEFIAKVAAGDIAGAAACGWQTIDESPGRNAGPCPPGLYRHKRTGAAHLPANARGQQAEPVGLQ